MSELSGLITSQPERFDGGILFSCVLGVLSCFCIGSQLNLINKCCLEFDALCYDN